MPAVHREIVLVDGGLRNVFRALAAGRAMWPLFLFGATGRGKTLAALAFADRIETASYWTVDDLCDLVMSGVANPAWWDALQDKEVAILDELGCRNTVGDLHYSSVKKYLDTREVAGSRSVLISNLAPAEFSKIYDDRICSRALCGTWFELGGPDRRMAR